MSDNEKIIEKMAVNPHHNGKSEDDVEDQIRSIKATLASHSRRVRCGAVVKIEGIEIMEEEDVCKMRTPYLYGIVKNLDEVCELTNCKAYQMDWAIGHVFTGNSFLAFAAPYFEHVFEVVKFQDEEDDMEDSEFSKLFEKIDGKWKAIETYKCEFCDGRSCDRALVQTELEDELVATRMLD